MYYDCNGYRIALCWWARILNGTYVVLTAIFLSIMLFSIGVFEDDNSSAYGIQGKRHPFS